MQRVKQLVLAFSILALAFLVGAFLYLFIAQPSIEIPKEITWISEDIHVIVRGTPTKNRTLHLDPNKWYCKIVVYHEGSNPHPWDLAYPNAPIAFFFLEDIEKPARADNWSDLIIRMNPILKDGKRKMCIVLFAEGAYEKLVYYKNQLIHHYRNEDPHQIMDVSNIY